MRLSAIDYTTFSASQLDQAYADAWVGLRASVGDINAMQTYQSTMAAIADEIIRRQANPTGFIESLLSSVTGISGYPQYNAIQQQTGGMSLTDAATSAVQQSAANVANTAQQVGKFTIGTGTLLLLGVGLILLSNALTRRA